MFGCDLKIYCAFGMHFFMSNRERKKERTYVVYLILCKKKRRVDLKMWKKEYSIVFDILDFVQIIEKEKL